MCLPLLRKLLSLYNITIYYTLNFWLSCPLLRDCKFECKKHVTLFTITRCYNNYCDRRFRKTLTSSDKWTKRIHLSTLTVTSGQKYEVCVFNWWDEWFYLNFVRKVCPVWLKEQLLHSPIDKYLILWERTLYFYC